MARKQLKTLTEPMYYVLLSLIKENHGYGIMQMISELTEGRVAVGAGTLYALLGRFEKEEIIFQVAEENRRKIYKLTDKGHDILNEEFDRLNKMVSDGQKFIEFEGQRPMPPDNNNGSGISMPVCEESSNEQEQFNIQKENPKTNVPKNKKKASKEVKEKKGFGIGGFGKGVLIPS